VNDVVGVVIGWGVGVAMTRMADVRGAVVTFAFVTVGGVVAGN
jgi:hypothetical protein